MVTRDEDAADVRTPPPLVYLACVAGGVLLHWLVARFELPLPLPARVAATALCGAAALALIAAAFGLFRRTGQHPKPWTATPELIVTGVYRFTRNPMYVALALVQAALAFALANGWILALVPVALGIIHRTAVRPEETYLEAKFGDAYLAYKRSVRRWL